MTKNFWDGRKALVTGAGGFIGSHLVEALVRNGARVRAMVRYNSRGTFGWLDDLDDTTRKSIEIMQGDLRDADTVVRLVEGQDTVFHLGAIISIPYSYVSPSEVAAVNVNGTQNVLNACRMHAVRRIIHTSTSEVYGTATYVPINEAHPLQGQSPYSASKIGADKLAESYSRSFDLPVITVRPFNTYGPRQSARAVIPTIIAQLLAGPKLALGSLETTRDFTYVTDTVEGFLCAATADCESGATINLGTSSEVTIGDLAATIAEIMGVKAQINTEDRRIRPAKSEVERLLSDNSLAKSSIGWTPKVDLRQGLTTTVEWMKRNTGWYKRAHSDYIV